MAKSSGLQEVYDGCLLTYANFAYEPSAWHEDGGQPGGDGAIGLEAVNATAQRCKGVVAAYFGVEFCNFRVRNVGRIGDDDIEGARDVSIPIRAVERASRANAQAGRIAFCDGEGVLADVDGDAGRGG